MMPRKDRIDTFGATVLVLTSLVFGLNQVLVKMVNAGMQPVFQAALRSLLGIIPLLLFAWLFRRRLSISDGSLIPGLVSGTFFACEFILLFQALDYTTVSRVSVIFYTMPVWLTIGAHFLVPGEQLTGRRTTGLALCLLGVIFAMASRGEGDFSGQLIGDLLCLFASMFWAAIALTVRLTKLQRSSPEMQLTYQLVVSAAILLPVSLLFGEWFRQMTPLLWGALAIQVIVVVLVGFLTWFWILSIYPASDMASFSFLVPVFGVLFGWLILDESITGVILLALFMVSVGLVLINRKERTS